MTRFDAKQYAARIIGRLVDLDEWIHSRRHRYVIAYHRVMSVAAAISEGVHSSLWITPETFATHLGWMRRVGDIVDTDTIVDFDRPNSRPWFALTFDDGWLDTYETAFPILKSYDVSATVYLASAAVDGDSLFWTQDIATKLYRVAKAGGSERILAALEADGWRSLVNASLSGNVDAYIESLKQVSDRRREERTAQLLSGLGAQTAPLRGFILSWAQAREMSRHGVSFGSHTHTHAILEGLPLERVKDECATSARMIASQLGREVTSFCYPNARFNGDEGRVLESIGYRYAFCMNGRCIQTSSDPYYLPRFLASEATVRNMDYFKLHLIQAPCYAGRPHRASKRHHQ